MSSYNDVFGHSAKTNGTAEHSLQNTLLRRHLSAAPLVTHPARMALTDEMSAIDMLRTKLHEQQLKKSNTFSARDSVRDGSSTSSSPGPLAITPPAERTEEVDSSEVQRLKRQLELTTERMAQMDVEINQFRLAQRTVEQAIGSPFPAAQDLTFRTQPYHDSTAPVPFNQHPLMTSQHAPKLTSGLHTSASYGSLRPLLQNQESFARLPGITPPVTPFPQAPSYGHVFNLPAPIGTRLSPTAAEFSTTWQPVAAQPQLGTTFMSTVEPLNYRRLLDRNMSCDWKYIIDKIVCNNDQQASIFLQQKLKVSTTQQKYDIVQGIIEQALPLMKNRFGNFLVQRCFEHGTPEQIVAIGQCIRGNTLDLSTDAFGCHVIQKAFDYVPEEYKAIMVHELLRRIPETVIHRYACHVWQKLFELRWQESPPQIMRYVNDALRGMWHEVALGETGSLVVQNIFENCLEEDKRPCIDEVLASIDQIAHGQFGNWCIQHICEHGAPPDRTQAVDHVIRFATEYSIDQFASKVVEKCLKIGGTDFLDRYLSRVCEARPDRPRMALIDIAGDQFGNYLIHYILSNADTQHRELVASHIRKHMVSLRGSKYGSRVAMLCCNPTYPVRAESATPVSAQDRYRNFWPAEPVRPSDRGYSASRVKPYIPYR